MIYWNNILCAILGLQDRLKLVFGVEAQASGQALAVAQLPLELQAKLHVFLSLSPITAQAREDAQLLQYSGFITSKERGFSLSCKPRLDLTA